ncbi:MAG TPA: RNase H family protein, partial [Bacillus sp. (in: firmicutes)]|nr:RNase H family protein [Bacillus sp. (in: firmicutes)]
NLPATKVAFGRLNATQPSTPQLILTHWMPTTSFLDRPTNTQIRRPHNLRLTPCPGCSLNDISIGPLHRRIHPNRKKSWSCVFACSKVDTIRITDGPHNPANNIATFPQPAAQYEFAAQSSITDVATMPNEIITLPTPSSNIPQASSVSNKLSATYRVPQIISALLPLALKLDSATNRNYTFYTDGAFSRSTHSQLPTICGSGFVAPSTSILLSQRMQLSFACTHWLSAYKAEVMALFVLLSIIPDNTQCTIHSDCQSLINTFNKVIHNIEPAQRYRRPMFPIWNLILTWIHKRNITVILVKVKGHSDDVLNQHADELARQGLTSPSFVISPNDIKFNTQALPIFGDCSKYSVLETDTRRFIQDLQQATSFEQLISLKRYEAIIPLHDRSMINWDCTFFGMQYDMMTSLHHTSFAQNRAFTWATKLLLNELPLLATLQRRRPDLYKAEWKCVSCKLAPETWPHLWSCSTILPKLIGLREATKTGLIDLLCAEDITLTSINRIDIDNLNCWSMTPSTSNILCFDLLIRGFIPSSLYNVVHSIVNTNDRTKTIIANMITIAQHIFKKEIWKKRNTAMIAFEKEHNISPTEKNKLYSTTRQSLVTTNSSTLFSPCLRWHSWMTQSMITGHPWLEFSHTY